MILAMVFAHIWGVLELVILGTLARTVRVRTVLIAIAVGLYFCAPLAIGLQVAWTRPVAHLPGEHLGAVVRVASYTLDPFIEELVKVLPLALMILLIPNVRRQLSMTDCVLIGAAAGSGFGLAENLFRYSGDVYRTFSVSGGWEIRGGFYAPTVPSLMTTISSWLPNGVAFVDVISGAVESPYNVHLVASALGGLAVALVLLRRGRARLAGFALSLYVGAGHAVGNWIIAGQPGGLSSAFAAPFTLLSHLNWLMPVAALGVAWWLDRSRQQGAAAPDLALAVERRSKCRLLGTLKAAVAKPPASIRWIDGLTRLRRAYAAAATIKHEGAQSLRREIIALRDRIDRILIGLEPRPLSQRRDGRGAWTSRKVIIWLVLMAPSILWFVLGGYPQTAWLQTALKTTPGWIAVRVLSLGGLVWIGTQLVTSWRGWSQLRRALVADLAAASTLGVLSGTGALLFGFYTFVLSIMGGRPDSHVLNNFHVLEAVGAALLIGALLMGVAAIAFFPPAEILGIASGAAASLSDVVMGVADAVPGAAANLSDVVVGVADALKIPTEITSDFIVDAWTRAPQYAQDLLDASADAVGIDLGEPPSPDVTFIGAASAAYKTGQAVGEKLNDMADAAADAIDSYGAKAAGSQISSDHMPATQPDLAQPQEPSSVFSVDVSVTTASQITPPTLQSNSAVISPSSEQLSEAQSYLGQITGGNLHSQPPGLSQRGTSSSDFNVDVSDQTSSGFGGSDQTNTPDISGNLGGDDE